MPTALASDLRAAGVELDAPAAARWEALADWSPHYAAVVRAQPQWAAWLEAPANRETPFRRRAFLQCLAELAGGADLATLPSEQVAAILRRFRRQMSLRLAYRDLHALATVDDTLRETTLLADIVATTLFDSVLAHWQQRLGTPWDDHGQRPARLALIALGKWGGGELNFCSDLDLLWVSDGQGQVRRDGRPTHLTNEEFFTRVVQDFGAKLTARTADGWLYHLDLRLRPEGNYGPLVRPLESYQAYYYTAGQTWERLMLLRARPIAGDTALGADFLDSIQAFRFPRHPEPATLAEIAATKARMERELGEPEAVARHLKLGPGGIRDIEFQVQARQLLHGGANPFLQASLTRTALAQLARYGLLPRPEAETLDDIYRFWRTLENRLQMREESQTHTLPPPGPVEEALARSLGLPSGAELRDLVARRRATVRALFESFFAPDETELEVAAWTTVLSERGLPPAQAALLEAWFRRPAAGLAPRLRQFLTGGVHHHLTREHVLIWRSLTGAIAALTPRLARPMRTLERLSTFAEGYGARTHLLRAMATRPQLLEALGLLFDRSTWAYELLRRHPDWFDDLFRGGLRLPPLTHVVPPPLPAPAAVATAQLREHCLTAQLRGLAAEALGLVDGPALECWLTALADAAWQAALVAHGLADTVAVVALGKHGAGELTVGSDLDVVLLVPDEAARQPTAAALRALVATVSEASPEGRAFAVDQRLRPHGSDGPLGVTLAAWQAYHRDGTARPWERQMLLRARIAAGNAALAAAFADWRRALLFTQPAGETERQALVEMLSLIRREKGKTQPPELAYKVAAGGLVEVEFVAQWLQWRHGAAQSSLHHGPTAVLLAEAARLGLLPAADAEPLLAAHRWLRTLERALRRQQADGATEIPTPTDEVREALPRWLDFPDWPALWAHHCAHLAAAHAAASRCWQKD